MSPNNSDLVGQVFKAPETVVDTGFVKVVASNTYVSIHSRWELKATEFDPRNPDSVRPSFNVSRDELAEWGN